jgi:hypothetical protein
MSPTPQGKTGWGVVTDELGRRIQDRCRAIEQALPVTPKDPVFDGLSDSDVVDLVDRLVRDNVDLGQSWDQVRMDAFWAADYLRRRGNLRRSIARANRTAVFQRMTTVESDDEDDDDMDSYSSSQATAV